MLLDRLIHIFSLEHYNDLESDKGTTVYYILINLLMAAIVENILNTKIIYDYI